MLETSAPRSSNAMEELISRICSESGVDAATAEKAASAILGFIRREGPPAAVDRLFAAVPGADAAAPASQRAAPQDASPGLFGSGLMALAGQLSGLGLDIAGMQAIGGAIFGHLKDEAGDDAVREVATGIPGLSQFV
jgi:hypothetical protein